MARLGSSKRPAVARIQTVDRAQEILSICDEHGWKVIVGVEPQESEDISDVEILLGRGEAPAATARVGPKVGRNASCPCGSGLKYKRCCGRT